MRFFIFFCILLYNQALSAQVQQDSVLLPSVEVYAEAEEKYLKGSILTKYDSTLKTFEGSSHLGEMLPQQFPIYFRNYGNGMISGISLRGTGPQHTAVLWNGINITSFSLGQSDFSLLPSIAVDEIKIHEGGGSARFGSGAFGGTVLLESASAISDHIQVSQQLGSFGRYFTALRGGLNIKRWSLQTKLYHQQSKNDFKIESIGIRQPHAAFLQRGILQDIAFKMSQHNQISLHYWHHESDREIQPTAGQLIASDEQQDENDRVNVLFTHQGTRQSLNVSAAFVNDVIVYNNERSTVKRWIAKAHHQYFMFENFHAEIGGEASHIKAIIENYESGGVSENRYDLTAGLYYEPSADLKLSLSLRQPFVTGFTAPFLPYTGIEYTILRNEVNVKLLANLSRNYRVPTLNDRYWKNAGNRSVMPEKSLAAEAGYAIEAQKVSLIHTGFVQQVQDWIQWEPQQDGDFVPKNINEVKVTGTEIKLEYKTTIDPFTVRAFLNYQFIKSITTKAAAYKQHTVGKQLIYTPRHTAAANLFIQAGKNVVSASAQLNGKRYADTSNDETYALPFFVLYQLNISRSWKFNNHQLDVIASVKNLSNTDYQLYSGRAMPGRNYLIQVNYKITPKNQ